MSLFQINFDEKDSVLVNINVVLGLSFFTGVAVGVGITILFI